MDSISRRHRALRLGLLAALIECGGAVAASPDRWKRSLTGHPIAAQPSLLRPPRRRPEPTAAPTPAPLPLPESAQSALWVTDDLLFHFQRCSRRSFLDTHSHGHTRDRPNDYLQKLREDSRSYRETIFQQAEIHYPTPYGDDWAAGAIATYDLMQQGVEHIANGITIAQSPTGAYWASAPDLLIKRPGWSNFGDWLYVPADVRLGKRPKRDYQMTVAYHAFVLAGVQGAWPETAWLFLRHERSYSVDLAEMVPRMEDILADCTRTLLDDATIPDVFIAHNRCDLCHWYQSCHAQATAQQHLSLLPGVTPSRYTQLQAIEVTSLEQLAQMAPQRLASLPGFGLTVAQKMVVQAQAALYNQAIAHTITPDSPYFPLSPIDLPTAPVELYFDIEAAPEHDIVYLHGVLVVDREAQTETFHALLAEQPEEEELAWEQLLELFETYDYAPIFHFCPYEVQTMQRLAKRFGTSRRRVDRIVNQFVDLHELVTSTVTLPVESYALKHIARWVGFEWRDAEANGAQSICWFDNWMQTGDRGYLDAILRYNEDDCWATYRLKDWLVEFAELFWEAEASA